MITLDDLMLVDNYETYREIVIPKPLKLEPYAEDDIYKMERCKEGNDFGEFIEDSDIVFTQSFLCFTLRAPEGIVAIGGFQEIWDGQHVTWVVTSPLKYKYTFQLFRAAKKIVEKHIENYNIRRLESFIEADYLEGVRWAQHLGFGMEGILQRWGHADKAYIVMAITQPEK